MSGVLNKLDGLVQAPSKISDDNLPANQKKTTVGGPILEFYQTTDVQVIEQGHGGGDIDQSAKKSKQQQRDELIELFEAGSSDRVEPEDIALPARTRIAGDLAQTAKKIRKSLADNPVAFGELALLVIRDAKDKPLGYAVERTCISGDVFYLVYFYNLSGRPLGDHWQI
ncbi:hypothetical protein ACFL6C_09510 [Myxococcota bacterium]